MPRFRYFLILPLIAFLIDQLLKYNIRHFGGFYICNKGISFGITLPYLEFWLFLAILILIILVLFSLFKRNSATAIFTPGLIIILLGALSNGLDRFFYGCVVDFIFIYFKIFPVINIADILIFLGFVVIIYQIVIKKVHN